MFPCSKNVVVFQRYEEMFPCLTRYEDWCRGSSQEDAKKSRKLGLSGDVSYQLIGFIVSEY